MNKKWYIAGALFMLAFVISCVPSSRLSYFTDIDKNLEPAINSRTQKVIAPFDKLYIKVYSIDPKTLQIFNSSEEIRYGSGANGDYNSRVDCNYAPIFLNRTTGYAEAVNSGVHPNQSGYEQLGVGMALAFNKLLNAD